MEPQGRTSVYHAVGKRKAVTMKTMTKRDAFSSPIAIFGGIGMIQQVASVGDALAFLDRWPVNDNFEPRIAAHLICLSALDGDFAPDAARQAFNEFADAAGILIDEAATEPALAA